MCYEFSGWHWKARAKELHKPHKPQVKSDAEEPKETVAKPAEKTGRKHAEVKQPEKVQA